MGEPKVDATPAGPDPTADGSEAAKAAPDAQDAQDALVVFSPSGRRGRFKLGTPVLDAARALGVYVESVCGGRGICGRCQVEPAFGAFAKLGITSRAENLSGVNEVEARYARVRALPAGRRLSCQARITGDLAIDIPADTAVEPAMVRKRAEARAIARDPATRLYLIDVEEPRLESPSSDLDRVREAFQRAWKIEDLAVDPSVLVGLQTALRKGNWQVTVAVHEDRGRHTLIAVYPGFHERMHGVAVDIGSTTIACHLVDIMSGRTVASAGTANPQIRFGEDLMSRVSYAMLNEGGAGELTASVRGAVNTLIARVAGQAGIGPRDILEAVIVGNPIMHHLMLGLSPVELGQAPFAAAVSEALDLPAREAGIEINPAGRLYVLPLIAGHVGADAAAVALAEGPTTADEVTLVVDVGTNAEIILGTPERLLAASSPTGPAFEGAEVSSGQRAAPGAIERVRIDPATLEPRIRVIGCDLWSDEAGFAEGTRAFGVTGICGSGIIEALAELFLASVISEDGVIGGPAGHPRIIEDGRAKAYMLWPGTPEIRIRQTDVRAIQLAKAALYAGAKLLMDKMRVAAVGRIKFAGAFGSHIDPKYAMILGLIPDCDLTKVHAVGNAAGTGARMALLNRGHRREVEALVKRIEKVETAVEPRFQEHFVAAMAIPNKVDPFTVLRGEVALPARAATSDGPRRRPRRERTP